MSKPEGLFFIREMAAVCGLSINALRFYEAKGLLAPSHTDPDSGYRYYSRDNLHRLRTILALKDAGLSLQEIRDYLDGDRRPEKKREELLERRALLDRAIENLSVLEARPGDLTVHELRLPERLCVCRTIRARDFDHGLACLGAFYDEQIRECVPISRAWPEFCEYPDEGLLKGEFSATDFIFTACLPVDRECAPPGAAVYPAGDALEVRHRGSYYELWRAYDALAGYMEAEGYEPAGYPQEIYVEIEPDGSVRPEDDGNITRVILPVLKKL